MTTPQEALDLIAEAEELLVQALEKLRSATLDSPHHSWADAYIINHLEALIAGNDPREQSLQSWKEMLNEDIENGDDDEDYDEDDWDDDSDE